MTLSRLNTHLSELQANPATAIDTRLFEEAELVLPEYISQQETFTIVQQLSALLQDIQQNPTPAVNLLIRLLNLQVYKEKKQPMIKHYLKQF